MLFELFVGFGCYYSFLRYAQVSAHHEPLPYGKNVKRNRKTRDTAGISMRVFLQVFRDNLFCFLSQRLDKRSGLSLEAGLKPPCNPVPV